MPKVKVHELYQELNELMADAAVMEADPERQEDFDVLMERADEISVSIKDAEEAERKSEQSRATFTRMQEFQRSAPEPSSQRRNGTIATSSVQVAEPEWTKDPMKGYKSPRAFLEEVRIAAVFGYESEQLQFLKYAAPGDDGHGTLNDPHGGYLVPEGMSPNMLMVGFEGDPLAGRTRNVPMTAPRVAIPARVDKDHSDSVTGGLRMYRRAEHDTVNAPRMEMERIALTAHPLMGVSFASEELLSDSPITFSALVAGAFQEEHASKLLDERINGTGTGEYLGVLQSPCLVQAPRAAAGQITYIDVAEMRARMWRYQGAIWLANHDTAVQLMTMELSVGSGVVWQPSIREDRPDLLLGRPIFFTEYVPGLGTLGDLICGNWGEYLEGNYQQIRGDESIHVRFLNNERTFRFTSRNDGQPWWRSPLTPRNGANNLSPFVALAA